MSSPSDAPVRPPGSHTRSGNAMLRTRTAILSAAERCVADGGVRRTTMSAVSAAGGIAKATLYNHFRTKADLLEGLLLARIDALADRAAAAGAFVPALQGIAAELAASPALHRVVAEEPEVVALLVRPGAGRVWDAARAAVTRVLSAHAVSPAPAAVDLVLRWLLTQAVAPAAPEQVGGTAELMASALDVPRAAAPGEGLGWPST